MIQDLLDAGGENFLIPVALFVLLGPTISGLFGLFRHRNQQRKEFLDLWDPKRAEDDLWLELAVRHMFGTHLPAAVIRLALSTPHGSKALHDLSDVWTFLRFHPDTQKVSWKYRRFSSERWLRNSCRCYALAPLLCLAIAVASALAVASFGPKSIFGWISGFNAIGYVAIAILASSRHDELKKACETGNEWIARINSSHNKHSTAPQPPMATWRPMPGEETPL